MGTPPPPRASHRVGIRRADVGGSKRRSAPYKALGPAGAADRAGRGESSGDPRTQARKPSTTDSRGVRSRVARIPGSLLSCVWKKQSSPLPPAGDRTRNSWGRPRLQGQAGRAGRAFQSLWEHRIRLQRVARVTHSPYPLFKHRVSAVTWNNIEDPDRFSAELKARSHTTSQAACAQDQQRWPAGGGVRRGSCRVRPRERRARATMRTRPQVCEALLFALALHTGVCYGIKWLALSKTPAALALNQTQHCKQLEGLVSAQVQLCRSNLELMRTIVHAAREAMKACRRAFADMRWNCSSIELAPNYLLDLERGTRESAFVYALSAATISHTIARACTSGDLPGCSCGPVPGEPPGPGNRWGGCADNLSYGLLMGAKFSDAPMKVKKTGSQANKLMRLHNSEVGRQALRASLETKCKCHGVSGSCSIRTCWKGLQELRDVAADLKTRYLSATKVVHRPMGTRKHLVPKDLDIRPVKDSELVYLQSSPDFCMKNEKVGSHGTQDRQCNKTSNGSDSCDLMCCGRGYNPYTDRVVERCHCKYHWCCYVTCRRCERTVERYVCK